MEKVTGIGGLFFRSKDPVSLGKWYRDNLGINLVPKSYDDSPWVQEAGPTVFAPFPEDTKYFAGEDQMFMINFRVRDLDAMILQLKTAGVSVAGDIEYQPNGRFVRIYDPESNSVELWEPIG